MTAKQLSEHLQVSERTIYRDVQSLTLSGVPVEGEAGVGYRLSHRYQLPPLMFDRHEVEALLLGERMVSSWGDSDMAMRAKQAMQKNLAVLPDNLRYSDENMPLLVPYMAEVQNIIPLTASKFAKRFVCANARLSNTRVRTKRNRRVPSNLLI